MPMYCQGGSYTLLIGYKINEDSNIKITKAEEIFDKIVSSVRCSS